MQSQTCCLALRNQVCEPFDTTLLKMRKTNPWRFEMYCYVCFSCIRFWKAHLFLLLWTVMLLLGCSMSWK